MHLVDLHVPTSHRSLELNPDLESLAATQAKHTAMSWLTPLRHCSRPKKQHKYTTSLNTVCQVGESAGQEKPSGWAFRTMLGSSDPTCAQCSGECSGCRACCVAGWRSRQFHSSPTATAPEHHFSMSHLTNLAHCDCLFLHLRNTLTYLLIYCNYFWFHFSRQ